MDRIVLGLLGNYLALIRAPGRKTFIDGSGSQRVLIRAPDRNNVLGLSGNYLALIRADRKTFIDRPGSH